MSEKYSAGILWICDRDVESGGIACALYDLYPALANTDCKIDFAAPVNAAFPRLEALGATVHKVLSRYPQSRGYLWSLMSALAFVRLAVRLRPTVVVAEHTNGVWLLLFLRAVRFPAKAIYRNHGAQFLACRPRLSRLILRGIDRIVTVSQQEVDTLRRLTDRPVTLVPNCLPAHCLSNGRTNKVAEDPQRPRIGFVGRLNREKGICVFIDLIAGVRKEIPEAQGIAIGAFDLGRSSEDAPQHILALMRSAGIAYFGAIAREEIFKDLDVLVVCSPYESFGLTIIEAPFSGVVPVAYDSPGTHFILNSIPACLVENGKIEEITKTVLSLWRGPRQRSEICRQLTTVFLREFDPKVVAARLMEALLA